MLSLCSHSAWSPAIWHGLPSKHEQPEGVSMLCWLQAAFLCHQHCAALTRGGNVTAAAQVGQSSAGAGSAGLPLLLRCS